MVTYCLPFSDPRPSFYGAEKGNEQLINCQLREPLEQIVDLFQLVPAEFGQFPCKIPRITLYLG